MEQPASFCRRLLAVGIGIFALWQMVFLVAANVIDLVPRRMAEPDGLPQDPIQEVGTFTSVEPIQRTVERIGDVIDAYSEFTGQEQVWPLFAPGFPPHSTFTSITIRYENGKKVELRSDFEPADFNDAPTRVPLLNVRRYNLEIQFTPAIMQHTESALADSPEIVRAQTFLYFRHAQPALMKWLRWRMNEYRVWTAEDSRPVEVILNARYVPTPLPSEAKVWNKPVRERPLVRWVNPDQPPPAGELPLQVYDVATGRWVTLLKAGGER